jgi:hypothetical protein
MTKETTKDMAKESVPSVKFKEIDITFMQDWQDYFDANALKLEEYIVKEIKRLESSKKFAVLSSILALKENFPKTKAMIILRNDPQFRKHTNYVKLALEPDAVPPAHDYNGALIPIEKRGHVLAAKSGLHSHMNTSLLNEEEIRTNPAKANKRDSLYLGKKFVIHQDKARRVYGYEYAPYVTVEIGREPTEVSFEEGINILNRYGTDIAPKSKLWMVRECF